MPPTLLRDLPCWVLTPSLRFWESALLSVPSPSWFTPANSHVCLSHLVTHKLKPPHPHSHIRSAYFSPPNPKLSSKVRVTLPLPLPGSDYATGWNLSSAVVLYELLQTGAHCPPFWRSSKYQSSTISLIIEGQFKSPIGVHQDVIFPCPAWRSQAAVQKPSPLGCVLVSLLLLLALP